MNSQNDIAQFLMKSRFMALGFCVSVVMIIAVFVFSFSETSEPLADDILPVILGVGGVFLLVMAEVVPSIIARQGKTGQLKTLLQQNFILLILENAFREAAAILSAVIFALAPEQRTVSYVLWSLVLLMMFVRFPTDKKILRGIPPEKLRGN